MFSLLCNSTKEKGGQHRLNLLHRVCLIKNLFY